MHSKVAPFGKTTAGITAREPSLPPPSLSCGCKWLLADQELWWSVRLRPGQPLGAAPGKEQPWDGAGQGVAVLTLARGPLAGLRHTFLKKGGGKNAYEVPTHLEKCEKLILVFLSTVQWAAEPEGSCCCGPVGYLHLTQVGADVLPSRLLFPWRMWAPSPSSSPGSKGPQGIPALVQ